MSRAERADFSSLAVMYCPFEIFETCDTELFGRGSFVGGGCGVCVVSMISCGCGVWVWDRTWFEGVLGRCEGRWKLCGFLCVGGVFCGSSVVGGENCVHDIFDGCSYASTVISFLEDFCEAF